MTDEVSPIPTITYTVQCRWYPKDSWKDFTEHGRNLDEARGSLRFHKQIAKADFRIVERIETVITDV